MLDVENPPQMPMKHNQKINTMTETSSYSSPCPFLLRDIALGKMQHQRLRRYAQPPANLALHRRPL
jgi:hypothetical protein